MCEKETGNLFHEFNCVDGSCKNCKDTKGKLLTHYNDILETQGTIKWQSWVTKKIEVNVRKDGEFKKERKTRRVLADNEGEIKDAVNALIKAIDSPARGCTLRQHIHCANWQLKQFEISKKIINPGTVVAVYDFSQNYTTVLQNEIKSAHYSKTQITLHPMLLL